MKQVQKGFTLIELMIVVAIIGILAAIAIPQYQDYIARSQMNRAYAEISAYRTAIEERLMRGEATDMSDTDDRRDIGFVSSNLGTASGEIDADGTGAIEVDLDGQVSAAINGAVIELEREDTGNWICDVTPSSNGGWKASFAPSGCSVGGTSP